MSTIVMILLGSVSYGTVIDEASDGVRVEYVNGKYQYTVNGKTTTMDDNILVINGDININDPKKTSKGVRIESTVTNGNLDIVVNGDIKIGAIDALAYLIDNRGNVGNITINGNFDLKENFINYAIMNGGSIKTIENNGVLKSAGKYLFDNGASIGSIINNNKMIMELNGEDDGELIYNGGVSSNNSKIETIENNGIMLMTLNKEQKTISRANIIKNDSGKEIGSIKNNGKFITNIITEEPAWNIITTGIYSYGTTNKIENNEIIEGIVETPRYSYYIGVEVYNGSKVKELRNNGIIYSGTISTNIEEDPIMYGVYLKGSVEDFVNKGTIYGKRRAVLGSGKNYGLLVNGVESTAANMSEEGLEVKVNGENDYTILKTGNNNSTVNIDGTNFTVKNASEKKDGDKIVGTNSIDINEKVSNTIYNGITDTVKVTGENASLDNVTVNAYTSAIVFGESGGNLTLNNSTVNGGIDRKYSDTGVLESSSAIIKGGTGADTLTVMGDTKLNGKIDLSEGEDTINFGEKVQAEKSYAANASTENTSTMTIFDDISGVENININEDVILFETAKVTDAKNIEIGEGK
ncbi:hypothetical protein [Fusobacterium necrogenes]|uniref:hypothetical protein n=1 Tax=Fusobacterium necrogenes TaxID=858 RepID=UPI00255CE5AC|nr:hypothetical protein [Fusobacterium necrogenes]